MLAGLPFTLGHWSHVSGCHLICKPRPNRSMRQGRCVPPFQGAAVAQKSWGFPKVFALAFLHQQAMADLTVPGTAGLSASKFPSAPMAGAGPQSPRTHGVLILPSAPIGAEVPPGHGDGRHSPAAGRLSGSSVAAPGSCCDTTSHMKDKDCCPLLCARLVSSHLSVLLFLPGYFLKAR